MENSTTLHKIYSLKSILYVKLKGKSGTDLDYFMNKLINWLNFT